MALSYSEYPEVIEKNKIYFYRSKKTLKILPCRIDGHSGNKYVVYVDTAGKLEAERRELLSFDPCSRLFRHLMRLSAYRESKEIRQALKTLGLDPAKFMKYKPDKASKEDANILEDVFISEMQVFLCRKDVSYRAEVLNLLEEPLPGTVGLRLFNLYKVVCANGGMDNVIHLQIWKRLFFRYMEKTNTSYVMRTFYKKYLYEFELERRCSEESNLNFSYIYSKGDHVTFVGKGGLVFCAEVVARRNRGLNTYYVRFLGWSEENNEWISEDILQSCNNDIKACSSRYLTPSKSSKANKLVDDPVTWEKHRHGSNFSVRLENISADTNSSSTHIKEDDQPREEVETSGETPARCTEESSYCKVQENNDKNACWTQHNSGYAGIPLVSGKDELLALDETGSISALADICEGMGAGKSLLSRVRGVYGKENLVDVLSEYNFAIYKMWREKRRGFHCS